jgi:drug/metabolite transporter (DMT)-like permease
VDKCISGRVPGIWDFPWFSIRGHKAVDCRKWRPCDLSYTFFVLIFASLILGEQITFRRLGALGMATLGVLIILDLRKVRISPELFWGNVSLICAALTWALYSVIIRKVTKGLPVLQVSLVCFIGGLPLTIPAAFVENNPVDIGQITTGIIIGIHYLGVISTGLAMYLWNLAFARLEAGVASLTFFAQPVVGAGLGALILGEELTPLFIIGGVLIGLGLILAADFRQSALTDGMQ